MNLQATIHKSSQSLNATVSPRAGGGRVQDVTYNGESVVNAEGVAEIPEYPSVPVQDVKYNNASVVNAQGVAEIPEYPSVPVKDVKYNNVSIVNAQGVANIPLPTCDIKHIFGKLGDSPLNNYCIYGNADIIILNNIAIIKFQIMSTSGSADGSNFTWGLNPELFKLLDNTIPTITPIDVAGQWDSFNYNRDRMQYGTTFDVTNGRWRPVRYYSSQTDAESYGAWSEGTIPIPFRGICFGTIIEEVE